MAAANRWDKYNKTAEVDTPESKRLRQQQLNAVQNFFVTKEKQAHDLAQKDGKKFLAEVQSFFNAGIKANWRKMNNIYWDLRKRSYQFEGTSNDERLAVTYWQCINESYCAYEQVASGEPKYVQAMVDDVISSIPTGSIYFGGTDPGRFLISAFSKSHVKGDPFFTLTPNALADGLYLQYLSNMYGGKIYTPTPEDSQRCFNEYLEDAGRRNKSKQLKPGEDYKDVDGQIQISGLVAVMSINALLVKTMVEKNTDREFYLEEGFPLDWMYPHLEPHGLIMKINRQPLKELSENLIQKDQNYWQPRMAEMVGDWLKEDTSVKTVAEFAEKIYLRKNLKDFKGDPQFVKNEDSQKTFSKLRASIGGVYAWRVANATGPEEQSRMIRAADFAFRQSVALSPNSPEAVFRYVNLLLSQNRIADAILVAKICQKLDPENTSFKALVEQLEQMKKNK
ncbi:MAG: tetratricopeptide repeat protein [Verrucomicrobiota bacterium]